MIKHMKLYANAIFYLDVLSLQTLADCKQRDAFRRVLKMHEERPASAGRTLENFLTVPMYRVSRYLGIKDAN